MWAFALAGVLGVGTTATATADESLGSANRVMSGCRAFLAEQDSIHSGFCAGLVVGVENVAALNGLVCPPAGSNLNQMTRIVVQYIDSRPARMHERFAYLALEALKAAWPCQKR